MSKIALEGNASGTGTLTIAAPNTNSNYTLTLPTQTGNILTSATTTGFPAGSVLQVVQGTYSTQTTSSSTNYADTGLTASITPTSSSSKILVIVHQNGVYKTNGNASNAVSIKLLRGSTDICVFGDYVGFTNTTLALQIGSTSVAYLDSPATTSSTTYKTQFKNTATSSASVAVQQDGQVSTITLMEIAA